MLLKQGESVVQIVSMDRTSRRDSLLVASVLIVGLGSAIAASILVESSLGTVAAVSIGVVLAIGVTAAGLVARAAQRKASERHLVLTTRRLLKTHGPVARMVVEQELSLLQSTAILVTGLRSRSGVSSDLDRTPPAAFAAVTGGVMVTDSSGSTLSVQDVPNPGEIVASIQRIRDMLRRTSHTAGVSTIVGSDYVPAGVARLPPSVADSAPLADHQTASLSTSEVVGQSRDRERDLHRNETTEKPSEPVDSTPPEPWSRPPSSPTSSGEGRSQANPVLLGASAPACVYPSEKFTARFVAYTQGDEQAVRTILTGLSPRSSPHLGVKHCTWKLGARVAVKFYSDQVKAVSPEKEFIWDGIHRIVDFDCEVDAGTPASQCTIGFDVLIQGIPLETIRLDLSVSPGPTETGVAAVVGQAAPRTAFASYASKDRPRVMDRVSVLESEAGLSVFFDCLDLKASEEWEPRIRREIASRELFYLFWSRSARDSTWVNREWRWALFKKGKRAIRMQQLETPDLAPPPDELRDIHCSDRTVWVRAAALAGDPAQVA